jgi:deoxyguanosine kinase
MAKYPYVVLEGPIAAGKTTLATMLANHVAGALVLEDFQGNEFLADFYWDRDRWALPMQLWFLNVRRRQLNSLPPVLSQPIIADYSHLKDNMFARVLLQGRELRLYQQMSQGFTLHNSPPDLIVYLDARDDVLLERIQRRGREYEQTIDATYIDLLRNAYEEEFEAYPATALLRYDTSHLDLTSEAEMANFYELVLAAAQPKKAT